MHILFKAYTLLTICLRPALIWILKRRIVKRKEDPIRYTEKMGIPSLERPKNTSIVWIHAVSVGESISALPLVNAFIDKGYTVLMTTRTKYSADIMQSRLPSGAYHQYAPLDCPRWIQSFLDYWHPSHVIFMESELWYNTLNHVQKRNIPLYLVNARLSKKSINAWKRYKKIARIILQKFTKIYAQNTATYTVLQDILYPYTHTLNIFGNIKYITSKVHISQKDKKTLETQIGDRPVWAVASTHTEDEQVVLESLDHIYKTIPDILTILIPRHPERLPDIQKTFKAYTQSIRSKANIITPDTQMYIADTIGEVPLFYDISPVSLVGGSFDGGYGGHNALEPARYNSAIIQGYDTSNFSDITTALKTANAYIEVKDSQTLSQAVCMILSDTKRRQDMIQSAKQVVNTHNKIIQDILDDMGI